MKTLNFTDRAEFDYGRGVVVHEPGQSVAIHQGGPDVGWDEAGAITSMRADKAQRWVSRGVAIITSGPAVDEPAGGNQETADDNRVEGAADVAGQDGGGAGERAVDEPAGGNTGQAGRGRGRGK